MVIKLIWYVYFIYKLKTSLYNFKNSSFDCADLIFVGSSLYSLAPLKK